MLQRIRDTLKNSKTLQYIVLLPLILVFAAWGAYGVVQMDFFGASDYAAKVDGETIPRVKATEAWSNRLSDWQRRFGGELPVAEQKRLQANLLEGLVRERLLSDRAFGSGYRVSREVVNQYVQQEEAFQIEGKYNDGRALSVLAQIGQTQDAYLEDLRMRLRNRELQRGVEVSNFLTAAEIQRRLTLEDEQREVAVLSFPADKFAGATPDDAALQTWLTKHAADYQTLESVRLAYAELQLAQVAAKVVVTDNDLRDLYQQNKVRYVTPERRRARHILIAATGTDSAAAQAKAQSLYQQALKPGADFAALARANSEDSQTAVQGGDLGWQERSEGDVTPELTQAIFSLQPGAVAAPVKTRFGFHIARLDEIQAGRARSFEEARADLDTEFRNRTASSQFGDLQEQLQQRIEGGGASLADLAREFGLSAGAVETYARGTGGGLLGSNADLDAAVFAPRALEQRRISGPVALGNERIVVFRVEEHRKPALKPLSEVRDAVVAAVRKEQGTAAAQAAAQAALLRINAGSDSVAAMARSQGLKLDAPRFVGRADPSLPAQLRSAVFAALRPNNAKGSGAVRGVLALEAGGAALFEVTQVRRELDASNAELNKQRVSESIARGGAGDVSAYIEDLRRRATVEKNPKVFE